MTRQNRAFTLIEVMIVLVLMGLLGGAVVTSYATAYRHQVLEKAGRDAYLLIQAGSMKAEGSGQTYRLIVDSAEGRFWLEQQDLKEEGKFRRAQMPLDTEYRVPMGFRLEVISERRESGRACFYLYPDGTRTGGLIRFYSATGDSAEMDLSQQPVNMETK